MKKIVAILFLLATLTARAQELKNTIEPAFQIGEQLSYKLKYGIFTAAEATLKINDSDLKFDDRPVFHLVAEGRTSGKIGRAHV